MPSQNGNVTQLHIQQKKVHFYRNIYSEHSNIPGLTDRKALATDLDEASILWLLSYQVFCTRAQKVIVIKRMNQMKHFSFDSQCTVNTVHFTAVVITFAQN